MSYEAMDYLTKGRPPKADPLYRCPAGRCFSVEPTFRCPHQAGASRTTERAAPSTAAAALAAEVVEAFTAALGAAATRQRVTQTRRDLADEAAFGGVAFRQRRRPW